MLREAFKGAVLESFRFLRDAGFSSSVDSDSQVVFSSDGCRVLLFFYGGEITCSISPSPFQWYYDLEYVWAIQNGKSYREFQSPMASNEEQLGDSARFVASVVESALDWITHEGGEAWERMPRQSRWQAK